jgi:hypothetical protein
LLERAFGDGGSAAATALQCRLTPAPEQRRPTRIAAKDPVILQPETVFV